MDNQSIHHLAALHGVCCTYTTQLRFMTVYHVQIHSTYWDTSSLQISYLWTRKKCNLRLVNQPTARTKSLSQQFKGNQPTSRSLSGTLLQLKSGMFKNTKSSKLRLKYNTLRISCTLYLQHYREYDKELSGKREGINLPVILWVTVGGMNWTTPPSHLGKRLVILSVTIKFNGLQSQLFVQYNYCSQSKISYNLISLQSQIPYNFFILTVQQGRWLETCEYWSIACHG